MLGFVQSQFAQFPPMGRFAIGMALILLVPKLSRRARLPGVVGLLLAGVLFGPHVLDVFSEQRPTVVFFGDLGKLLLMFFAGLGLDLALFRQRRFRAVVFGVLTTAIPLLLGTQVALWLGYSLVPAIVVGSLLASHTLLGLPIVTRLKADTLEPVVVAVSATVMSDTLSLVVFAVCLSIFVGGFSMTSVTLQLAEIVVFVPLVLFGLSRVGARLLKRMEDEENAYLVFLLLILAVTSLLAEAINLPGIVGTFLAGLAVNAAVRDRPAAGKLESIGNAVFIPAFFFVTGFLIDPVIFARSLVEHLPHAAGIILALLLGKWLAAQAAGLAFGYTAAERMTVWSLTLPQVAATLAATLVAFHTHDPAGHPLLDETMLNAVLVMLVATSILGPVLTQRYAPQMRGLAGVGEPAVPDSGGVVSTPPMPGGRKR
jgi:Kef-type K+ transport system membrane component KefB